MAWSSKDAPTVPKGATAFGVRLLDRFVAQHYEKRLIAVTEIGFYHLLRTPLERALPKLLERARAEGHRNRRQSGLGRAGDAARRRYCGLTRRRVFCRTVRPATATQRSSRFGSQTVTKTRTRRQCWCWSTVSRPRILSSFARCADMFDGNDDSAVEAARERWRRAREAGHVLTYWQQTAAGWERRG